MADYNDVFDGNPTPPWLTSTNGDESGVMDFYNHEAFQFICGLPNATALLRLQQDSGMSAVRGTVLTAGRICNRE